MNDTSFATVQDVTLLFRPLSQEESGRCAELLPVVSDLLRQAAVNHGKDLDAMIAAEEIYPSVVKIVTVDVVSRALRQSTTGEPMSQESQTALGYNWQGTFAIPGGGVANAIMNNDLKRLGLIRRQKLRTVEMMEYNDRQG